MSIDKICSCVIMKLEVNFVKLKRFSLILLIIGFIGLAAGIVALLFANGTISKIDFLQYHWPRCVCLLSVLLMLTALVCLIFPKTIKNHCSVKTSLLALGISLIGGLGILCFFNGWGMAWSGGSEAHPVKYPLTRAIGGIALLIFMFLILFYIWGRKSCWSLKGLLIDLATSLLYIPAFSYVFLVLYYVVERI